MDLDFDEIVDLTHPIEEGMTTYPAPWHPVVAVTQLGRHGLEGRETHEIKLGTHTGTHIDAPRHFVDGGPTISSIPLDSLMGPVEIIDFTELSPGDAVTRKMLEGQTTGPRTLFRFGWDEHYGTPRYYDDFPYLTEEAASYLVEEGTEVIGFDTPSPDDPAEEGMPVHSILLEAEVVLLEYLTGLDGIDDLTGWNLIALPLNVPDMDGAPVRALLAR